MRIETIRRHVRKRYNQRLALGSHAGTWEDAATAALRYANAEFDAELGGSYGVEFTAGLYYINVGDTYKATIIFDTKSRKFYSMSLGDFIEWQHVRFEDA